MGTANLKVNTIKTLNASFSHIICIFYSSSLFIFTQVPGSGETTLVYNGTDVKVVRSYFVFVC